MDLHELLGEQDGLVRRDQALACGLGPSAIDRRLRSGGWVRVHARTYRAVDHVLTDRTRVRAVALGAGDDAVLSGRAAAFWWRLTDEAPEIVTVVLPPGRGHAAPTGVSVARRAVDPDDRLRLDGVMVTERPLTVLDAAVESGLVDGARLMDRALLNGAVATASLRSCLEETSGRRGTALARRLVELAEGGARSEAERMAGRVLRRGGNGGWLANHAVRLPGGRRAVLDIAFPAARLVIEVDGWAYHRDVDRMRSDHRRGNDLVIAGWRVLRISWYELQAGPDAFVSAVRDALRVAAA